MKNSDQPFVSIVIPVFNGSNYLKCAIDSALNQTYVNCEVIVINDGSDDNGATEKIVQLYKDKVRYYYKTNGGVASALNYGISKMRGEYFAWLSHDDWYLPDKIQLQMDAIKASGNKYTLVQGEYIFFHTNSGTYTNTDFHKYYSNEQLTNSVFTVLQLQIHACSALIHKSHFDRVGMFDETLKTVQDIDTWFRIFRDQTSIFLTEALHYVREHAEAGSNNITCYYEETGKLYIKLIESMSLHEMQTVFGNASVFLCRMAGFLKSYGRSNEYRKVVEIMDKLQTINQEKEEAYVADLQRYLSMLSNNNANKIAIFGAGQYGIRMKYELNSRLINIDYFVDNNIEKQGKIIEGIPCISFEEILKEKDNILLILAQRNLQPALNQIKEYNCKFFVTKQELDAKIIKTLPAISRKELWA